MVGLKKRLLENTVLDDVLESSKYACWTVFLVLNLGSSMR